VVPKTKIQSGYVKTLDPSVTIPANADSLAQAEALRRAYIWLSPFKSYGSVPIESIAQLKTLDLSTGNPVLNGVPRTIYMGDDSLVHLLAFRKMETITVPIWMTNKGLAIVVQMPALKNLYMADSKINNNGLAALPPMPNIKTLVLFGTAVDNTFMQTIGIQFPGLEVLNVGDSGVTDAGLAEMPPLPTLHKLILTRGSFTDAYIPEILKHPNLQFISVEFTQITAAGREQIKAHFPGATVIPE
jgi:hypothetical protein